MNYSYNGIELPELPEWDKETYPYAMIEKSRYTGGGDAYFLYTCTEQFIWKKLFVGDGAIVCVNPTSYLVFEYLSTSNSWRENGVYQTSNENNVVTDIFEGEFFPMWTNADILKDDGSVYLPASYPIDTETGEEIHDYEIGGEPETDLTNIDLYRKIDGQPTKLTLYKKVGGKLVALDEYTKEVKT